MTTEAMVGGPERIPLAQVRDLMRPGEPLPFDVRDSLGRLLLAAGQRIVGLEQLQALLERGASVERPEVERVRAERASAAAGVTTPSSRRQTWFDVREQQVWVLDTQLRALGEGRGDPAALVALADLWLRLVDAQPDAALFVTLRQDQRRFALYALTHALDTATVAVLCARQLAWEPGLLRSLLCACLTMNASIVSLQALMAEQADPPSKRQLDQIRAHPQASAALLRSAGVDDEAWLSAVEDHHERDGGTGYPRGLAAVGAVAQLLRAADVFTAKISPRALRPALSSQAAAHQLLQEERGPVASALIRSLGVYPPGDYVRLKSGETAIVVRRGAEIRSPQVALLLSAAGKPVHGAPMRDTAQADQVITGVADRQGLPRVLPEAVYGLLEP